MKRAMIVILMLAGLVGCSKKPPMLHVTAAAGCGFEGTFEGKTYVLLSLHFITPSICDDPIIGIKEVGQDFPATVDLNKGTMTVRVQSKQEEFEIRGVSSSSQ